MPRKRKYRLNKLKKRIKRIIVGSLITVFTIALFALTWGWVSENAMMVLLVTGISLLILILFKQLAPNKVKKRVNEKLGI